MDVHEFRELQLLTRISTDQSLTQRSLAKTAGLALGLTNLLIRRLVKKGYVQLVTLDRKRIRYLLTPKGMSEKVRLSYEYLDYSLYFYRQIRTFLSETLSRLEPPEVKTFLLYGTGEVAEIAFLVMQQRRLNLVGVVDGASRDNGQTEFMNLPVRRLPDVPTLPFDRIVVASPRDGQAVVERLGRLGVPKEKIILLPGEELFDGRDVCAELLGMTRSHVSAPHPAEEGNHEPD